jgi:pyroglutamyl-peptidase
MVSKILLTSFDIWLSHHQSNSSDDLLEAIASLEFPFASLDFLRKLPVDIDRASSLVIDRIDRLKPDFVVCCGMAESRQKLTIESCACCENEMLTTSVDLENLVSQLTGTSIGHDAGKFVCEGLYYQVLNHLKSCHFNSQSIFIHVPLLTKDNFSEIVKDCYEILRMLSTHKNLSC